jgi:hypothetical protein
MTPSGLLVAAKCVSDIYASMMGRNPNTLGCIFRLAGDTIKSTQARL